MSANLQASMLVNSGKESEVNSRIPCTMDTKSSAKVWSFASINTKRDSTAAQAVEGVEVATESESGAAGKSKSCKRMVVRGAVLQALVEGGKLGDRAVQGVGGVGARVLAEVLHDVVEAEVLHEVHDVVEAEVLRLVQEQTRKAPIGVEEDLQVGRDQHAIARITERHQTGEAGTGAQKATGGSHSAQVSPPRET